MIVLVCGGRDYVDRHRVFLALDHLHEHHPISRIVHGAARGADSLADQWALARNVPITRCRADWEGLGKRAGIVRNQSMLTEHRPGYVVAFPGGIGTADMMWRARSIGLVVWEPYTY